MAKYTTGDSVSDDTADACELCGTPSDSLRRATVAGASLLVCPACAPHDDGDDQQRSQRERSERSETAVTAGSTPLWDGDSEHWETEGTGYDDDPLPYLLNDYGTHAEEARQAAGLKREELAEELDIETDTLLAIEQGRAARASVPGSIIAAVEDRLDVTLSEE